MTTVNEMGAAWDAKIAIWEKANAVYDAAAANHDKAIAAAGGIDAPATEEANRAGATADAQADSLSDAKFDLLVTPAPDFDAVLWKMARLYQDGVDASGFTDGWSREYTDAVIADIARLAEQDK